MTEKIRLEIDDATSPGIQSVEKNLEGLEETGQQTEASLNDVVASIESLTEKLQSETKIVHEHTSSWTHFGSAAIPAVTGMVTSIAKYSAELSALIVKQQAIQAVVEKGARSQAAFNLAKDQGAKAAAKAAGALTGHLEVVSGGLAILAGAKATQIAYNTLLENTGKSADGLTNNLTRTREANSALWDDIKATASAGADAAREWGVETVSNAVKTVKELTGVDVAWKEVDRAMTESTKNYVENTRIIGEAIRGVSREAIKASRDVANAQAESVDDFERVRTANDEIAKASENRAESERLSALTTVDAINSELQAMKDRRGQSAAAGKFDEDQQKSYVALVGALEQRRTEITKRNSEERQRILKQEADQRRKSDADQDRKYEDLRQQQNQKILDEYDKQAEEKNRAAESRQRDTDRFIREEVRKIVEAEQEKIRQQKAASDARIKLAQEEYKLRIAAATGGASDEGKALAEARGSISQDDLRKQVVEQAKRRNRAEFVPQGDDARTFGAQRNRAERQAGIDAFRQFNAGQTSQADIAGAQNTLIQQATQAAAGRGQLDQQTAQALIQATQNQQQITAQQEQQANQIKQIQAALSQVGNAGRNLNAASRRAGL